MPGTRPGSTVPIDRVDVSAFRVPTEQPESDGTYGWDSTTIVVAEVFAGGRQGLGYTYADLATATLIRERLAPVVEGREAMAVSDAWQDMIIAVRNLGRSGIASMAIAAVDTALWDLKARLLDLPLVTLLGKLRDDIPVYGSGGFTSYSVTELQTQLAGWADQGIDEVKIKIGSDPGDDLMRVKAARDAIGPDVDLFVDANGAYEPKQALKFAEQFAGSGVTWFEEPVTSDDLEGLRLLRDRAPAGMEVAAGEYGYDLFYFRRMLEAGAVDVLQADVTRCAGVTELLNVDALCQAWAVKLSAHTAPALHAHPCCAMISARNVEYFHDHVRLENMLFDGVPALHAGRLKPDLSTPGNGLTLKRADAAPYAI